MKKNILVVDDEPEILNLFHIFLETAGYLVDSAPTAVDAVDKLRQKKFHLALLDVNLPDARGMDLLEKINHIQPDMIKIVISGESSQYAEEARGDFFDAFLQKPVSKEKLLNVVARKLREREGEPVK